MKMPAQLWTTQILAGLMTTLMVVGLLIFLLVQYSPEIMHLTLGQWSYILGRPIVAVLFLITLIRGIRRRDAVGYWLSLVFWIGLLLYLGRRALVFGLAGDDQMFPYDNEAQKAGGTMVGVAFLALCCYVIYSFAFGDKLKKFFERT